MGSGCATARATASAASSSPASTEPACAASCRTTLGHAAVISGAGPTVLVLTTADRAAEVHALPLPQGWRSATPGIPTVGVRAVRLEG